TLADLKNTTDDALSNYLTSLKFKQSHFLTDVRLALGYSAVLIAAITFYTDYRLGWDKTKEWTLWAVLGYFTLNGALTFWIWGIEKGKIFAGEFNDRSTGRKSQLSIASSVAKHNPIYNITVDYSNADGEVKRLEFSSPFTRWFDVNGFFVAKPFQQWLASEIPIVGQVDPTN
ncbi:signal peptidase complex subunit 2, partial [Usnea florida]